MQHHQQCTASHALRIFTGSEHDRCKGFTNTSRTLMYLHASRTSSWVAAAERRKYNTDSSSPFTPTLRAGPYAVPSSPRSLARHWSAWTWGLRVLSRSQSCTCLLVVGARRRQRASDGLRWSSLRLSLPSETPEVENAASLRRLPTP